MPVPQSARGNAITGANFEAPFETPIWPYGTGGLDLASPIDRVSVGRYTRLTNASFLPNAPGGLTVRPGLTAMVTGTGNFHTIQRFEDPQNTDLTYLWGVGTTVALGTSGAVTVVDTGYSNFPLTVVPYHPPLSGDPWLFIADSNQMRKVRFDGLALPMGLPAPTVAAVTSLDTIQTVSIADFNSSDGTQASAWTANKGATIGSIPQTPDTPNTTDVDGTVLFEPVISSDVQTVGVDWYSFWGLAKTINLAVVGGVDAEDADIIHLLLRFENPQYVLECRVYLVCSVGFSASVLPGSSDATNTDFFVKSFRPDDFAGFVGVPDSQVAAAATARGYQVSQQALAQESQNRGYQAVRDHDVQRVDAGFMAGQDPERATSRQSGGATSAFIALGTLGIPLARGDFRRYGTDPDADWDTITGIIIYVGVKGRGPDAGHQAVLPPQGVALSLAYLQGGAGPNTIEPDTQSYDVRYTNFDPRTGDESNPSPTQADAAFLDSLRTPILMTPAAYGDSALRQRFYRRGGILTDDWYFLGVNDSDGGVYRSIETDLAIAAAGTLALDNYEPIPTVDDAGNTVLGQPVPVILGPTANGQLFALGDPYRPGTLYASKPGQPDHWPPDLRCEVCGSGEPLQNGTLIGGQLHVFSNVRGYLVYPNLLGASGMTATPSGCTRGLAGRWAITTGLGLTWAVAPDGIFCTNGGPEEIVSDDIAPLFRGQTVHGYAPVDFSATNYLRLTFWRQELYFTYQSTDNNQSCLVYTPATKQWRPYDFSSNLVTAWADVAADVLIFGLADRAGTHTGFSDFGDPIAVQIRTAAWDWGRPREEKLFGDQILDLDSQGVEIILQNFVNLDATTNPQQTLTAAAGNRRAIFDSFGTEPQKGRTLATEIRWSSDSAAPVLFQLGTAITPQPDITINRVTNWDDLGTADESYVMGITLDANTGGQDRTLYVERDWQNTISTIATLTVNHDGRHKRKYSWPALPANQVRLRPDNDCGAWMCFRADWISKPEPPRIAKWDTTFENAWDQYLTGLDLYVDTGGIEKAVIVEIDGNTILNPATGLGTFPVTANGRQVVHLTLPTIPPLRGHVLRFYSLDDVEGLLYDYRWQMVAEPSEQANWNQPFTILGTQADKFVKAVVFEIDTFGVDKTVAIEADGVIVDTVTVHTAGRLVQQIAIPQQLGRVWRFLPTDASPSRLYSLRLVFDEEPFALTRWETQELDHGQDSFHSLVGFMLTLKSTAEVTLRITTYVNQLGDTVVDDYAIPSTLGLKLKRQVQPLARKGVLYKYLLLCDTAFWLYQEETFVTIQPWAGGAASQVHPIGNSDVDPTRRMVNASIAAAQSGGGT